MCVRERLRSAVETVYGRHLAQSIEETPDHIAVIQDGNRRYAKSHGKDKTDGHQEGARTTEQVVHWCQEFDIRELTLYAFSTENFDRPPKERAALFDLIEEKLYDFADAEETHKNEVRVTIIGERERLPDRVRNAAQYAERQTAGYDRFVLNIALAYGGRATLLSATQDIATKAAAGALEPAEIDVQTVEAHLYEEPISDVDLIIRTGGAQRTSNFLPWHANGNEAAVFFCTPYWPSFSRIDFLRGLRTYEAREESWQQSRLRRAVAVLKHLRGTTDREFSEAEATIERHGAESDGNGSVMTQVAKPVGILRQWFSR